MPLLADLFFRGGGIPRLQLGFDSPNKAAVLLGCLALVFAVAAFRARRRFLTISFGAVSCLAWCGLVLTYSRGGLVAFSAGLLVVLGTLRRRLLRFWPLLLLSVGIALTAAVFCSREKGFAFASDASVGNRLEIWRTAPRMVADAALTGWGIGNAGDAYMGWYQPLRSHERYRTLVSSHLTWLVELGLGGRMAYCAGWLLMLGICLRRWRRKGDPLPLSVWLAFGLAATFSSVAESPVLWFVPVAVAFPAVVDFVRNFGQKGCQGILAAAVVWGALLSLGLMWSGRGAGTVRVSPRNDVLFYGKGRPQTWIVNVDRQGTAGAGWRGLRTGLAALCATGDERHLRDCVRALGRAVGCQATRPLRSGGRCRGGTACGLRLAGGGARPVAEVAGALARRDVIRADLRLLRRVRRALSARRPSAPSCDRRKRGVSDALAGAGVLSDAVDFCRGKS